MIDTQAIRNKILDLAIRGKLTEQLPEDGTAEELFQQIQAEKAALVKEKKIKKTKPLPEITEDETPFKIPSNWKWCRLGEISLQITDGAHRTPKYMKEGIPFLSVKNISAGFLDMTDIKYISSDEHEELVKRCKPERNDILICRIGTLGRALRIDTDIEFSIFVSLGLIKTGSRILSDFIAMVINSGFGMSWIQAHRAGGAMHADKINLTDLQHLPIPLPPTFEQEKILVQIEELLGSVSEIDKAQDKYFRNRDVLKSKIINAGIRGELTEQLPEDGTAEELYQQIKAEKEALIKEKKLKRTKPLPEIIEDEIPFDIPDTWKWIRLEDLGENIPNAIADGPFGSNLKSEHYTTEKQVRIIQLSNVGINGWRGENERYTTFEHLETISRSRVYPGEIVIAKMMPAGRAIIVPDVDPAFVLSSDCVKFVPNTRLNANYLCYAINSTPFRNQVSEGVHGIGRERTSVTKLKSYLIPLPPLAEQERIVEKIDSLLAVMPE